MTPSDITAYIRLKGGSIPISDPIVEENLSQILSLVASKAIDHEDGHLIDPGFKTSLSCLQHLARATPQTWELLRRFGHSEVGVLRQRLS